MTIKQLIKDILDEMGEMELEEVLIDNDLIVEVINHSSSIVVTLSIETVEPEEMH